MSTSSGPGDQKPLTEQEIRKETQRMKRARTLLLMKHPFFGYLAAKLTLVATDRFPSMATDGRHLWFNPRFTAILKDDQTLTGFVHEVMHCASGHHERQGPRKADRWKKACDYAINPILVKSGFSPIVIPGKFEWLCDPAKYGGKTAEAIYDIMPPDPPDQGKCGCTILPADTSQPQTGGETAAESNPSPSPVNWKRAVAEAAAFARMRGNMPGHLEEMVEAVIHPKVDWRVILRSAFSSAKKTDWSWRRPNRRYAPQGIVLPTPYGFTTSVEWWGDTSGSVGPKFFSIGLGAAVDIAREFRIRLDCGVCDSAVQGFWKGVKDTEILRKIRFLGRGGTDFRPIFKHLKDGKRNPDCLVIVTDLMGTFPDRSEKPKCQVIWLAPESSKDIEVPFGRRLFFDPEENR